MANKLQTIKLGFGESEYSPNLLTEKQLNVLLKVINDNSIPTKEFSGYITVDIRLDADTFMLLEGNNITFVGDVDKVVRISSDNTEILAGGTVTFSARVLPKADGELKYRLYHGGTLIPEGDGTSTFDGVTLNCNTGVLTTDERDTLRTVRVSAFCDGVESEQITISVKPIIEPETITVNGTEDIVENGEYDYTIATVPAEVTIPVESIEVEIIKV